MDDFLDRELKDRLSRDPFPGGGFDDRLRRKIEERIRGGSRQRRGHVHSRPAWTWPAAALVSFSVLLMAVWLWGSGQNGNFTQTAGLQQPEQERLASMAEDVPAVAGEEKKYALLIGLRTERQTPVGFPVSEYRTLLVAADQDPEDLHLAAELNGLYMPYGQHFWQIAAADGQDGRQFVHAFQATGVKLAARKPGDFSAVRLSEQVAYAGNAYLSVHTYYRDEHGGVSVIRHIKHIEQLNKKAVHPADDPHAPPAQYYPDAAQDNYEWIIYRNPGAWVSELYDPETEASYRMRDIPQEIVQHDRLNVSWEEIFKLQPAARDAFTYGNLLGIITDRELQVVALRNRQPADDPVRVPLASGEQVVMIQWAQNDKIDYVEKWSQMLGSLGQR